jgi:hypothetical protein
MHVYPNENFNREEELIKEKGKIRGKNQEVL